jgi:hypothetical protein
MARVSHWQEIFQDDADRERFPSTLGEACGKTLWQVHAYCLMHKPARLSPITACSHPRQSVTSERRQPIAWFIQGLDEHAVDLFEVHDAGLVAHRLAK